MMSTNLQAVATVPAQATRDDQVLALWLHGRSPHTARAYRADVTGFTASSARRFARSPSATSRRTATRSPVLASATRGRRLAVVKSLFSFAQRIGYITFNVTPPVQAPADQERAGRAHPAGAGRPPHDRLGT